MKHGGRIIYLVGGALLAFAGCGMSASQAESRGRIITPVFERTVLESSPRVTTRAQRLSVEEIYRRPKTPDLVVFPGEHSRYEHRRVSNLIGQARFFGEGNYHAGSHRNFGRDVIY